MEDFNFELLWLVPVALSLVFMLWVIWELEKQIRREKRHSRANAVGLADRPAANSATPVGRRTGTVSPLRLQ